MREKLMLTVIGVLFLSFLPTIASGDKPAFPSWDQKLSCSATNNCPRFEKLATWGNAAVMDHETGLVWEQSPSTHSFGWYQAQWQCNNLETGGRVGWRLPTIQELASLVDPLAPSPGPTLPPGHPFSNVQQSSSSDFYWSATDHDPSYAWGGYFFHDVNVPRVNYGNKQSSYFVWCVRGGQGANPE